ncbi:secreted RxLR effector protein 161-like [Vitis vinifera]|uniref:secreted RxLR effector protein 161-like n=1 Tax=Vitis vinifera TaxID=29760 RepID=UPI002883417C|nr:secreted RxLR effector protein 161-like [Vitis vinifera]
MDGVKSLPTPMLYGLKLSAGMGDPIDNVFEYRSVVGALQYITITRPKIAFSVNKVCQFMQKPLDTHWKVVKQILRYLNGITDLGIVLKPSEAMNLVGFCDVDWGSDVDDRRSTSGHCVFLGKNLVSWSSKKQHTISRSSTKAEYRSLASLTSEMLWLQSFLFELQTKMTMVPVI